MIAQERTLKEVEMESTLPGASSDGIVLGLKYGNTHLHPEGASFPPLIRSR